MIASFSRGYAVCNGLFLAGIAWSVRGAIVSDGCLLGIKASTYVLEVI